MFPPIDGPKSPKVGTLRSIVLAVGRAFDNISTNYRPGAATMVLAVAGGVGLAIVFIAASNGVEREVLAKLDLDPPLLPAEVLDTTRGVLNQTRSIVTWSAYVTTAVVAALTNGYSIKGRQRNIAIQKQHGMRKREIVMELLFESSVLCVVGGGLGVLTGRALCWLSTHQMPLLPMRPESNENLSVVVITVGLSMGFSIFAALYYTYKADLSRQLP